MQLDGELTAGQCKPLVMARVDVGPLMWTAGLDRYSVVNVRRIGEHAEASYPCVRYADRLLRNALRACGPAEPQWIQAGRAGITSLTKLVLRVSGGSNCGTVSLG